MSACLDEETILGFCRGSVLPDARPAIEAHISECDECRALVSAVARSSLVEPKELVGDPAMAPTTPAEGLRSEGTSVGLVAAPVHPGDRIAGKYVVDRILGSGGMGVVVAARHLQLDQIFALKFLLPSACEAPGAVARFLREGKAAARITSEHVARVVDTGTLDDGAPYLVMEYLEGADLGAVTSDRGSLPPLEAIEYVLQACEAVVEAHSLGIVHRDLKPANLFLTRRKDGSPLVKVLDFGISKSDGGSRRQLTSASVLMGSPRYMSPEQMVSAKDVDVRTDIWAFGVILYELVTGRPVWNADTVQGLCALIASAPAPPLRQRAPHAPLLLEQVVSRCLAKSPDDRIASVADFALALAPIAPPSARMSIDRVLRVAGGASRWPPRPESALDGSSARVASAAHDPRASTGSVSPASTNRRILLLGVVGVVAMSVVAFFSVFLVRDATRAPVMAEPTDAAIAAALQTPSGPAPEPTASTPQSTSAVTPPSASLAAPSGGPPRASSRVRLPVPPETPSGTAHTPASSSAPALPSSAPNRALTDRK